MFEEVYAKSYIFLQIFSVANKLNKLLLENMDRDNTKQETQKKEKIALHTPSDEGVHFKFDVVTGKCLYNQHIEV